MIVRQAEPRCFWFDGIPVKMMSGIFKQRVVGDDEPRVVFFPPAPVLASLKNNFGRSHLLRFALVPSV